MSLASIDTGDLERLARSLPDAGQVTRATLAAAGVTAAELLLGLPGRTARLVIEAVLAERRSQERPELQLVWTGPEPTSSTARDTAVVLRELFEGARRRVLVAGFRFDHGDSILAPLHAGMRRGVTATFFLNLTPQVNQTPEACARAAAADFLARVWTFGDPRPRLFHDPRTAEPGKHISLHAKCVVVDDERTLVTSANFTRHGQERNVEVGVLVRDAGFAAQLTAQFLGAAGAGRFVEMGQES